MSKEEDGFIINASLEVEISEAGTWDKEDLWFKDTQSAFMAQKEIINKRVSDMQVEIKRLDTISGRLKMKKLRTGDTGVSKNNFSIR